MTYILFVIGFVLLIKGADLLVNGASSIALKFKISPLVIGLTIVAFGTSAPELVVNMLAAVSGKTDLAVGNILGSNIANIFLILGITSIIAPIKAQSSTVRKEIPFSLLGAILLLIVANDVFLDGTTFNIISRTDGLILLGYFFVFLVYTFGIAKSKDPNSEEGGDDIKEISTTKSILYIVIGLIGLAIGGEWIVNGATQIASKLGMSETIIGLTIVAIGTSLPELATSIVAALKKQSDIAIGNIVGSNIFNIFWILGLTSVISPIGITNNISIDIGMVIFATLILFFALVIGKKHTLTKVEGIGMLSIYIIYIVYLVILA